jgi:hypothetical protein
MGKMSDNWETCILRLSVFTDKIIEGQNNTWWEDLLGRLPIEKSFKPNQGKFEAYGLYKENEDQYNNVYINLSAFINKIDWYIAYRVDTPITKLSWGKYDKEIIDFENLMTEWLKSYDSSIIRIAFGAVLSLPVKSKVDGYKKLNEYLPEIGQIDSGSSDFLYQINRPQKSEIKQDLKINRLSKWNVIKKTIKYTGNNITETITSDESYHCMLEMDINTDQDNKVIFESAENNDIFTELVRIGTKIVNEGNKK